MRYFIQDNARTLAVVAVLALPVYAVLELLARFA